MGALFDVDISKLKWEKACLLFEVFVVFFMNFLVIYYQFTFEVLIQHCVHRLAISKKEANGEKTSGIESRLKVPLRTIQKVI